MFFLIGVLCPESLRLKRLIMEKNVPHGKAYTLMEIDKAEDVGFGQKLLETLHHSDFFIRNDNVNINSLNACLDRYVQLILSHPHISPNLHEYAMYCAQSAALRSSCLSRQVGASIIGSEGGIISTGYNDVPKGGGGMYSDEDTIDDGRCKNRHNHSCKNSEMKDELKTEIQTIIDEKLDNTETSSKLADAISKMDKFKGLLEYSRSVHAEMDAITSVARYGKVGLKDATLYCTTFPCHHCTRHIISSGISYVYFIEPYEKSLARKLHDAIELDPEFYHAENKKVKFIPFEGVAPKQYLNLFKAPERKHNGKSIDPDMKTIKPRHVQLLDPFMHYEKIITRHLDECEGLAVKGTGGA